MAPDDWGQATNWDLKIQPPPIDYMQEKEESVKSEKGND